MGLEYKKTKGYNGLHRVYNFLQKLITASWDETYRKIISFSETSVKLSTKIDLYKLLESYYRCEGEKFTIADLTSNEDGQIQEMILRAKKQLTLPEKLAQEGVFLNENFNIDMIPYMYPSTMRITLKQYYLDNQIAYNNTEIMELKKRLTTIIMFTY